MNVTIPCPCPPKGTGEPRHTTDTVTFRDRLDFRAGMVIRKSMQLIRTEDPDAGTAEYLAAMSEHYMLEGIEAWTLVDEKGKAVEVSRTAIRSFLDEHGDIVFDHLVDAADTLYYEQVMAPLVRKALASSPPSPTEPSTSQETGSEEKHPRPSRRSSTSTTPTGSTATITELPVGGSSTSRKSA